MAIKYIFVLFVETPRKFITAYKFTWCFHKQNNYKSSKIVKIANHFITLGNFDHLLSQTFTKFFPVLPSILSKYQFHFDQLWANITSILTNFDQRLNYWGGVTPPTPPYSDVPDPTPIPIIASSYGPVEC
jgi:hypothetical protein